MARSWRLGWFPHGWLGVAICLAACNGSAARRAGETKNMSEFSGTITVGKPGELDAEIFLLHADGKVAAVAHVPASGAYAIAPPAGYGGGWLLAKLYRPVIRARAVQVNAGPEKVIDVNVAAAEAVVLDGRIVMPDEVPLEWLDVHVTPRIIDGLPEPTSGALLAVGPQPVRRGTYVTTRITQPAFTLAVLPGVYRLEVERLFHDSAGKSSPRVSVQLGSVDTSQGPPAEPAPIGVWLTLRGPVSVTVKMVVVPPERL